MCHFIRPSTINTISKWVKKIVAMEHSPLVVPAWQTHTVGFSSSSHSVGWHNHMQSCCLHDSADNAWGELYTFYFTLRMILLQKRIWLERHTPTLLYFERRLISRSKGYVRVSLPIWYESDSSDDASPIGRFKLCVPKVRNVCMTHE